MIPGAYPVQTFRFDPGAYVELMRNQNKTGGGTITADNYMLTCASPGTDDKAYVFWNVYLPVGAFLEVTCEAKQNDSYRGGRIAVDLHPDKDSVGGNNVDYVEMEDGMWKPYKLVVPGSISNNYASVTFGQWITGVGSCSFRNIRITVYNGKGFQPQFRGAMIRGVGSSWDLDDGIDRFANFGCTAVEAYASYLVVRYEGFESWHRPLAFAQWDQYGGKQVYRPLVQNATHESCTIYIVDSRNGSIIDPRAISGTNYLNFMAMTY
jgi:uncharacterized Zn-finger protein